MIFGFKVSIDDISLSGLGQGEYLIVIHHEYFGMNVNSLPTSFVSNGFEYAIIDEGTKAVIG